MTSEAWRYQLRAEGIERRPQSARPDRGYVEQPGEESKPKSSLLIPLSVLRDEEEKAVMAELLEEERREREARAAAEAKREEDERQSGIRPSLPPAPPPTRPRIITRGDMNPERKPLRAPLADFVNTMRPAPENETRTMPPSPEPDEIDKQIQALLAKHEEQQRQSERHQAPPTPEAPKEHPTLLSRPQPPETESFESYHEPRASDVLVVGSDGRRYFTPEFKQKTAKEYIQRRAQGENLLMSAYAESKGIAQSLVSRWVRAVQENTEESDDMPTSAGGKQANGKRARRAFTDDEKVGMVLTAKRERDKGRQWKDICEELDVSDGNLRIWEKLYNQGKLRPTKRPQPAAREAAQPKSRAEREALSTFKALSPIREESDRDEERDVGTVMAELQATKQRLKELKLELMELL